MAEIKSGSYRIRSLGSGRYIGIPFTEDISDGLTRVVNLPGPSSGHSLFEFERTSDNEYKVAVNGGRLVAVEGYLFATRSHKPYPDQQWRVVRDRSNNYSYIIVDPKEGLDNAWKNSGSEDQESGRKEWAQIQVGFLWTDPPFYPPDGLWGLEHQ